MRGRVQGVNFRATAADQASRLGLRGLVRNRDDGAVECIAEGERAGLERFEQWLGRGPRLARVERVETEELSSDGELEGFRIE